MTSLVAEPGPVESPPKDSCPGATKFLGTENAFKIGPYLRLVEEAGHRVIKCNLGEPDFPLPAHIRDEVKRQLDADLTITATPRGSSPCARRSPRDGREAGLRSRRTASWSSPGQDADRLLPGGVLRPGDEVIYPSPGFPIYESFTRYVGAHPVPYHLDEETGFDVSARSLFLAHHHQDEARLSEFPSNPTGGVLDGSSSRRSQASSSRDARPRSASTRTRSTRTSSSTGQPTPRSPRCPGWRSAPSSSRAPRRPTRGREAASDGPSSRRPTRRSSSRISTSTTSAASPPSTRWGRSSPSSRP